MDNNSENNYERNIYSFCGYALDYVNSIIMFNIKIFEIKYADRRILYNLYKDKIVIMEIQYNV